MEDKQRIKIMTPLSTNDKVEFLQFSEEQLTQRFGFRQSQDILNRFSHKRPMIVISTN